MVNKIIATMAIIMAVTCVIFFNLTIYSLEMEMLRESAFRLFITIVTGVNALYDWHLVDSGEDDE